MNKIGSVILALFSLMSLMMSPVFAPVAPTVYYYGNNTADGFVRSFSPMILAGDGYGISQSGSTKGAVVMSDFADNVAHETSAGFVININWVSIEHLVSIDVAPPTLTVTGSTHFALNLWIDTNPSDNSGPGNAFFAYSSDNILSGLSGDVYALGPSVGAGEGTTLHVDASTSFFLITGSGSPVCGLSNGATMTLGNIQSAITTNCGANTIFAGVWIGLDIPAGTTGTGNVVIPPVSFPPKLRIVTT